MGLAVVVAPILSIVGFLRGRAMRRDLERLTTELEALRGRVWTLSKTVADFERAGFVLDGQSDILRNPADDHNVNVFDAAIRGKTDRVIFRFKKPS